MGREAAAVARDIERRFLGVYLEKWRAAMEGVYRLAQAQAQARDVADELATILGGGVQHERGYSAIWSRYVTFHVACGTDEPYITVERIYSLPVALAKQVARVLAGPHR